MNKEKYGTLHPVTCLTCYMPEKAKTNSIWETVETGTIARIWKKLNDGGEYVTAEVTFQSRGEAEEWIKSQGIEIQGIQWN